MEESKFGGCACVIYAVIIKVQYGFKHQLIFAAFQVVFPREAFFVSVIDIIKYLFLYAFTSEVGFGCKIRCAAVVAYNGLWKFV